MQLTYYNKIKMIKCIIICIHASGKSLKNQSSVTQKAEGYRHKWSLFFTIATYPGLSPCIAGASSVHNILVRWCESKRCLMKTPFDHLVNLLVSQEVHKTEILWRSFHLHIKQRQEIDSNWWWLCFNPVVRCMDMELLQHL